MKKILIVLLSLVLAFSFTSCGNSNEKDSVEIEKEPVETEAEYRKLPLNTINYDNYICINEYYYSQVEKVNEGNNHLNSRYNIYTDVHIETSKKKQCYFENVEIVFSRYSFFGTKECTAYLDTDGYSHISYLDYDEDTIFTNYSSKIEVTSVKGYVYVPVS